MAHTVHVHALATAPVHSSHWGVCTTCALCVAQAEWVELLQAGGEYTVTSIGSVVPANITPAFRVYHKLSKTFTTAELTGPTYQRWFVAERCVRAP